MATESELKVEMKKGEELKKLLAELSEPQKNAVFYYALGIKAATSATQTKTA